MERGWLIVLSTITEDSTTMCCAAQGRATQKSPGVLAPAGRGCCCAWACPFCSFTWQWFGQLRIQPSWPLWSCYSCVAGYREYDCWFLPLKFSLCGIDCIPCSRAEFVFHVGAKAQCHVGHCMLSNLLAVVSLGMRYCYATGQWGLGGPLLQYAALSLQSECPAVLCTLLVDCAQDEP
jgi:hypothetical protein